MTYEQNVVHSGLVVNPSVFTPTKSICRGVDGNLYCVLVDDRPDVATSGNDSFTKLLLHCNGNDGSTSILDSSASAHTVSAEDDAQLATEQIKFGSASCSFGESGDGHLEIPDSADWHFGSGDFTIDFWIRFRTLPSVDVAGYYIQFHNNGDTVQFYGDDANAYFDVIDGGLGTISLSWNFATLSSGVWYHFALTRNGSNFRFFLDGVSQGTEVDSSTIPNLDQPLNISYLAPNHIDGWIDEYRISKGIARWTSNFTPPSAQYDVDFAGGTNKDILVYKSEDDGSTWGDVTTVDTNASGEVYENPSIVCDGSGILHIIVNENNNLDLLEYLKDIDLVSWSSPVTIASYSSDEAHHSISAGEDDDVWVLLADSAASSGNLQIFKSSASGVWGNEHSSTRPIYYGNIEVDDNGIAHAIWNKSQGGAALRYANSLSGWEPTTLFWDNGIELDEITQSRFIIDINNNIHGIYTYGSESGAIRYYTFDPSGLDDCPDQEITPTVIFDPVSGMDDPITNRACEISTDTNGNIYVTSPDGSSRIETWIKSGSQFVETGLAGPSFEYELGKGILSSLWPKLPTPSGHEELYYIAIPTTGVISVGFDEILERLFVYRDDALAFLNLQPLASSSVDAFIHGFDTDTSDITSITIGESKYSDGIIIKDDAIYEDLKFGNIVCRNSDADLFAVIINREETPSNIAHVYTVKSEDDGATWCFLDTVAQDAGAGDNYSCANIVSDSEDILHVLFADKASDEIIHYKRDKDALAWTSVGVVTTTTNDFNELKVVAGPSGTIYALISDFLLGQPSEMSLFSYDGSSWSNEFTQSVANPNKFADINVLLSDNGDVHIINANVNASGTDTLVYRNSFDGPWTAQTILTQEDCNAKTTVTRNGYMHLVSHPSGTTLQYRNFQLDDAPYVPSVSSPINLTVGSSPVGVALTDICCDLQDKIYISYWLDDTNKNIFTFVDDQYVIYNDIPNTELAFDPSILVATVDTLYPQINDIYINIPSGGFYNFMLNVDDPDTLIAFYDADTFFQPFFNADTDDAVNCLLTGHDGPEIEEIENLLFGHDTINDDIFNLLTGDDFDNDDIDCILNGVSGIVNNDINCYLNCAEASVINCFLGGVSGIVNSDINAVMFGNDDTASSVNCRLIGFTVCT